MTSQASPASPYGLIKPFIWLALLSFLLGFSGFLFAGASSVAQAQDRVHAALPVMDDAPPGWNGARPI